MSYPLLLSRTLLSSDMAITIASCPPPLDGSIHELPGLVDFHAENNPDYPWVLLAMDTQAHASPKQITFLEFAKATHRVAHILRPEDTGFEGEVVAVLVNCDTIIYLALLAGMIRAGLVVCWTRTFPLGYAKLM